MSSLTHSGRLRVASLKQSSKKQLGAATGAEVAHDHSCIFGCRYKHQADSEGGSASSMLRHQALECCLLVGVSALRELRDLRQPG